jgi:hypothetical protein
VSADEKRQFLGQEVAEIDERLSVGRNTAENENLWPVVFDVIRNVVQRLNILQGRDEL